VALRPNKYNFGRRNAFNINCGKQKNGQNFYGNARERFWENRIKNNRSFIRNIFYI